MKTPPLLICALISLVLWCFAGGYYTAQTRKLQPEALANRLETEVQHMQLVANTLLKDQKLWAQVFSQQLPEPSFELLKKLPVSLMAYEGGQLIFWNNNKTPEPPVQEKDTVYTLRMRDNIYLTKRHYLYWDSIQRYIDVSIPIFRAYPVSNEYIQSYFPGSPDIPAASAISTIAGPGSIPIRGPDQVPICYIRINKEEIPPFHPNGLLIGLSLVALLCSIMTVHLAAFRISHRFGLSFGGLFLFAVIAGLRALSYRYGLPFHLGELELFSPQVFAASAFLPSLGDLLLNLSGLYWVLQFVLVQYERLSARRYYHWPAVVRWGLSALLCLLVSSFCLYLLGLIRMMVLDSTIGFNTNSFNATDGFTLLVLVIIAVICRLFFVSLQLSSTSINKLIPECWQKYAGHILMGLISILFIRPLIIPASYWQGSLQELGLFLVAFLFGLIYIYLKRDTKANARFNDQGLFTLIFWSVYCSIICAVFFKFYITRHERYVSRIAFAEKLSRQQDAEMELTFPALKEKIATDSTLRQWLVSADSSKWNYIQRHLDFIFLESSLPGYTGHFFVYNAAQQPMSDAAPIFDSATRQMSEAIPTMSEGLFFRNQVNDNGYYLASIPVADSASKPMGYVIAEIRLKKNIAPSLYPKLLQDQNELTVRQKKDYSYAIYSQGALRSQSGDHNFLLHIGDLPGKLPYWYYDEGRLSKLYYRGDNGLVYVVVHKDSFWLGVLTIFSFLFAIYLVLRLLEDWFVKLISFLIMGRSQSFPNNWSLSMRIKYFALSFTIISFFVIGISTVIFLTDKYKRDSNQRIEMAMSHVSEILSSYFQDRNQNINTDNLKQKLNNQDFIYTLSNIALQQKLDINIYDIRGHLVKTTQKDIYSKGLLARLMAPSAYFELAHKQLYRLIRKEQIGSLSFSSIYTPIVNYDDQIIGYLNIPSFSSNEALSGQIRSLLTTLVNIYTILLLLSSAITFLFINSLSNSLRLVANSLKNVNLEKNELIYWPYKDEIGLLVSEYNKMVVTVEKNAMSLVKDERQNAWREMAKQVAHEIKNPLTPMKLNMQYLQQAINNGHPDIVGLARRVAGSIIEQIDNLNYIASEFSNFAKMPEKSTEEIELNSILERIVALYENETNLEVSFSQPEQKVRLLSDKSQMLRIFTNIIQNATDAIPDDRFGIVKVVLQTDTARNGVRITISDNGSGIPDVIRNKIFEPYFTTKTSGTGLGLAMTKKIIELWGGSIGFESEPDTGTTFHIFLPYGY